MKKILAKNRKKVLTASGITLIALIVTIIVLLILAGVTLSLIGGSEGILGKATNAVDTSEIAGVKEDLELKIAEWIDEFYEEKYINLNSDLTKINHIKTRIGTGIDVKKHTATVVGENGIEIKDRSGNTVATGILLENGEINWGEEPSNEGGTVLPEEPTPTSPAKLEGLEIGSVVSYRPNGSYNWQAKYCSSTKTEGTDDVTLSSATGGGMNITTWKVLKYDTSTGEVQLVPNSPTIGTVYLGQAQGYNNAVKLLNDACSALYSDTSKGISARSINIEDIENCMTEEGKNSMHSYTNVAQYGKQVSSAYSSSYSQYPSIYEQEKLSVINGRSCEFDRFRFK